MKPKKSLFSPTDNQPDKGQLIILGAVIIALIMVGWITIFNTASYTDIQRADGTADKTDTQQRLINIQHQIEVTVEQLNHEIDGEPSDAQLAANFTALQETYNNATSTDGSISIPTDPGDISTTSGQRIWQENVDTFEIKEQTTDSDGNLIQQDVEDWVVAESTPDIRAFGITYYNTNSNAFEVEIETASGVTETYQLHEDRIENGTGETFNYDEPTTAGDRATIDFTSGTVNGILWKPLENTTNIQKVTFNDADEAEGVFSITPRTPVDTDLDPSNTGLSLDQQSQDIDNAVYSAILEEVIIQTADGRLTTSLEILPRTSTTN